MKFAGKISMLDRVLSDLKADRHDPFEQLSPRERNALADYHRSKTPVQQFEDVLDGKSPTAALLESVGLNADCTEQDARDAYEREVESFNRWYKRRSLLGKVHK